jgi:type IV pilus assembly protein PilZ
MTSHLNNTGFMASPGWSDSVLGNSTLRPSVMQLTLKDRAALFAAYIPSFTDGGIFSMTSREYSLGDELYVLLSLPDDPHRHAIAGIVAWITPANAQSGRSQGVGIKFPNDQTSLNLKRKIEALLGSTLMSERQSQTI